MHDPVHLLRWLLHDKLTPEGSVYIEVPNFDSRTARLLGPEWPLLYVPRHLLHFTRQTLGALIGRAGGIGKIGRSEIPMMGNVLALKSGQSRFSATFKIPGIALFPAQLFLESVARQGTCLYAIVSAMPHPEPTALTDADQAGPHILGRP
jgi:hypothetical protein